MYYFVIAEAAHENKNIGVVAVQEDAELSLKLVEACEAHFDEEIQISEQSLPSLLITNLVNTKEDKIIRLNMKQYSTIVSINQTWLY